MQNCGMPDNNELGDFNVSRYIKPGLTADEVIGIKRIFESLKPNDGVLKVERIQKLYKSSYDKPMIDEQFGAKKYVNFEEFYEIMACNILEKKKKFKNIEFDTNEDSVSCLYCPYPVNKGVGEPQRSY